MMKGSHLLLLGVVGLVIVVVVVKASQPQQPAYYPQGSNVNGLWALGGALGTGLAGFLNGRKVEAPSAVNYGTYNPGGGTVTGNTLTDPNTGRELTYGTD